MYVSNYVYLFLRCDICILVMETLYDQGLSLQSRRGRLASEDDFIKIVDELCEATPPKFLEGHDIEYREIFKEEGHDRVLGVVGVHSLKKKDILQAGGPGRKPGVVNVATGDILTTIWKEGTMVYACSKAIAQQESELALALRSGVEQGVEQRAGAVAELQEQFCAVSCGKEERKKKEKRKKNRRGKCRLLCICRRVTVCVFLWVNLELEIKLSQGFCICL